MRTPVLAFGLVAFTAPLLAQDTTARRDTAVLAPTIVTVTRSPAPLAGAPFAIAVAGTDDIRRGRSGLALDDALAGIAGVQVDNRFNYALGERISVRGIGARAQFGVRGVRVLLDGIPMTLADGQTTLNNVDVSQLGGAEVIRGPASMLHGNAAGGVIQLVSERGADITGRPLGGALRVTAGSHGLLRTTATVAGNRPGQDFAVTVSRLRFEGFRQWSDARNDHATVRFARPLAGGSASLVASVVDYDGKNPGALSHVLLAANRDTVSPSNFNNRTGEQGTQAQVGGAWERPVRGANVSLSAHGLQRAIDNPIPGTIVVIDRRAGGARLAVDGGGGGRPVRLAAGAELQLQDDDRRNFANSGGTRGAAALDQRERVANASVFTTGTASLGERISLLGGARWDRIAFRASDRLVTATNGDDSGERTMSTISPSLGVAVHATRRTHLFANVSTAFETPTLSELSNQESGAGGLNPDLEPQRALSTEVGARGSVRTGFALGTWELSLYSARVRDALIPYQNSAGRTYYRNAAATANRGVEAATRLVLPAGMGLRAAFTHTDARFDDYAVTGTTGTTTFDGLRVPGVAANRFEGTVSAERGPAFAEIDARVYSSVPVNDANTDRARGYTVWGARLGLRELRAAGARVTPTFAVQNAFDRDYITAVTVNGFGARYFEPGPGRTFNAGISLNY